jgi:hypothetical protein
LTFGPVFLDLTLGQNSLYLLAAVLVIGGAVRTRAGRASWPSALTAGLAVGAKLFPLLWLGALVLLRRWRLLAWSMAAALLILGAAFFLLPDGNRDYWSTFLVGRITTASEYTGLEDQSLGALLDRVGRPQTFQASGLRVTQVQTIVWTPPWNLDAQVIRGLRYALLLLLALAPMVVLWWGMPEEAEGAFYLWVLYVLVLLPHMERYNHVLLLPAMAWLWGRGGWRRDLSILAYLGAGLSRLTHLWAILLPAPWGPLASGFGLYTVFLLGCGLTTCLWPRGLWANRRIGTAHPTTVQKD